MNRVVLTGLGVVSSIGTGAGDFTASLRSGRSGASPITAFDTEGFVHRNGCEVRGFVAGDWIRTVDADQLGRASRFSVAAARMAVDDAGLSSSDLRGKHGLISVGTTDGEAYELDTLAVAELAGTTMAGAEAQRTLPGRLATEIARELGLSDVETETIGTACAAGNYAIGDGFDAVRLGEADFALCGGADAICRKTFAGFYRLGTIAPEVCQPFDADRQGILTGEGAGILILEPLDAALARGARIYAEVLGYGLNCDARHPVAPDRDSVARCIELALADAGIRPGEVDLISAHGTGTKLNDVTEAQAIRQVYGAEPPPTVSLKSMLGHAMGAASAIATAACALAITHGFIPPTINHVRTDPECGIDCVPNRSVEAELDIVQNTGLAFGGNNAVVILGKYRADR